MQFPLLANLSEISQFINNLYCWIYCSYILHILFHSETKITLFYLFLFAFIWFYLLYNSLLSAVIRYHSLYYYSLSLIVSLVVIRCHSLSLVVTRCTTRSHSLSFVEPLAAVRCHSLSLVVTPCTNRCYSLSLDILTVCLFINDLFWRISENGCFCLIVHKQICKICKKITM